MLNFLKYKLFFIFIGTSVIVSCNKNPVDGVYNVDATSEMSQQIGDTMASIDEAGGSASGGYAINTTGYEKAYARLSHSQNFFATLMSQKISDLFILKAYADTCNNISFSSCANGQSARNFSGCIAAGDGTNGYTTISGNVLLNFTGTGSNTCTIPLANDFVTRVPNYTISGGLRGATFAVTAPNSGSSSGQKITRLGAGFVKFDNAGINRKFTNSTGTVVLDVTTSTTASIIVTLGANGVRANRSINNGGSINVMNNLTSLSCTLSPNNITWTAGCSCPTSGSWIGSCSDSTSMSVVFSGTCGSTLITKGTEMKSVTMDRCQ